MFTVAPYSLSVQTVNDTLCHQHPSKNCALRIDLEKNPCGGSLQVGRQRPIFGRSSHNARLVASKSVSPKCTFVATHVRFVLCTCVSLTWRTSHSLAWHISHYHSLTWHTSHYQSASLCLPLSVWTKQAEIRILAQGEAFKAIFWRVRDYRRNVW